MGILLGIIIFLTGCNSGSQNSPGVSKLPSYQFVIDAGSSGSRIYIYSKLLSESGLIINNLYESKINIPLASFAKTPELSGKQGIQPLLMGAIRFLQSESLGSNLANIPTSVLGTAGMRLLPESQQELIYKDVAATIMADGLQLDQTQTITGQYEGIYSWADINYLQNNFGSANSKGILEVGGASTQIAFATSQESSKNIINIVINGRSYNVYSISLLGLGQDTARIAMNQLLQHNFCYPIGYNSLSQDIFGNFDFNSCAANYNSIMELYPELNQVKYTLGYSTESFIGVSSVYHTLKFWGIESQPNLLSQKIKTTCTDSLNEIISEYPDTYKPENQCANSTFINEMIFTNLRMGTNQIIALNTINGTALSWTLGYVLINR